MTLCPYCRDITLSPEGVCRHHLGTDKDWHKRNRILCNFFHRGEILDWSEIELEKSTSQRFSDDVFEHILTLERERDAEFIANAKTKRRNRS